MASERALYFGDVGCLHRSVPKVQVVRVQIREASKKFSDNRRLQGVFRGRVIFQKAEVVDARGEPAVNLGIEISPLDTLDLGPCVFGKNLVVGGICLANLPDFVVCFA